MAAGVPVVTARAGALPEAVGDAALLVDPTDVDALGGRAQPRARRSRAAAALLVSRGHERVQDFSWATAVDEFVALYRRARRLSAPEFRALSMRSHRKATPRSSASSVMGPSSWWRTV